MRETTHDRLRRHRLVAILRAPAPGPLDAAVATLVEAGVRVLEVTVPTPGALAAIARAASRYGDEVAVGGGTVTTVDEVRALRDAGAAFVVSPHFDPAVVAAAHDAGLVALPGALSPTEVVTAWRAAGVVKLFPVPGPRYVAELRGPLPDVPLVPTGGVRLADVPLYLAAGAVAVGVGSPLLGDALAGGSLTALRDRAVEFVAAAQS
ncbi:MAG: bifunctional 4-hydroxy-2-oxoglutarate aldolase/2-dehydro-3-deoxy-phosphogluconate aldolase [Saccharothrix sp.]|nr:bifunctional 4-hydroxy-2-oxoglutarate aldolase/2-dehydro-3-deoxy-phosphogluconate aldolase [Saccharothrix sp.]